MDSRRALGLPLALPAALRGLRRAALAPIFAIPLFLLVSSVLLLPHSAVAQTPGFSWPQVDPADLTLNDNPASRGSHAMFLNVEDILDDPQRFEIVSGRIKVFDEEGKKFGDFEIPYNENETDIQEIHARTVNPDGTTLDFQGQVFDQLVVKTKRLKYRAKVFSLPDVQIGSIIDYSYRIHWRREVPEWLREPAKVPLFNVAYSSRTATWEIQRKLYTRRAHFVLKPFPKASLRWYSISVRTNDKPHRNGDGSYELEVKDIPGMEEEEFMPPESTYRSRIEFFYLVGDISSNESFWYQTGRLLGDRLEVFLSKHKRADRLEAETVAASDSPETKIRKLYERAQKTRNLSHEHVRSEKELKQEHLVENKSVDDVAEHQYGWGNEANYLFAELARAAGFDARIVSVRQRDNGIFSPVLLDQGQLTALVVFVHTEGRDYYLDPAEHLCPFPLLPWYEAGAGGIRLDSGGGFITSTPPLTSADAVVTRKAALHLDPEGTLQGKLEVLFTGQSAFIRRKEMADEDTTGRRKNLEDAAKSWLPPGSAVDLTASTGWDDATTPLRAEFSVSIPNQTVATRTRLLLPLAVTVAGKRNPFRYAFRTHAVDLRFPYQEVDEVTFELPKGFEVEAIPAVRVRSGPAANYELSSTRQGSFLVVKRKLVVGSAYYRVENYPGLRAFFSAVKTADQDRAVLHRVKNAPSN